MKVIYYTATTLNGFLATEDDSLQWLFDVGGEKPDMGGFFDSVAVAVMGSTTYEWMLREQDMLNHPEKWTEFFGARPVYVFSSRDLPRPDGPDIRMVNDHVGDVMILIERAVRDAGGGNVWVVGGGDLAGQFLDAGALDEIVLSMAPVFLPAGKPLLPRAVMGDRLHLREVRHTGRFVEVVLDVVGRGVD